MLLDDIKTLKTGKPELRKFGLVVGGVFAVLGLLLLLRGKASGPYFLVPGLVLAGIGAAFPAALKHVYIGWMALALVLGFVVSHVILTLFFYLVMTPTGLVARLLGKDFLGLKIDKNVRSYWVARQHSGPKAPQDYERQF